MVAVVKAPSATALALRASGLVQTPRLWVTPDERDLMIWAATKHMGQVQAVIAEVRLHSQTASNTATNRAPDASVSGVSDLE